MEEDMREPKELPDTCTYTGCRLSVNGKCTCIDKTMCRDCDDREVGNDCQ